MTGSFRFEPCPSCCVVGCVYESDDFNRANSTDLGAKWTETAGDWSIDANRLKIAAGTNVARVYVNDSGQFAELEMIAGNCGRLRLYDGTTCKGSVGVSLSGYTGWTRLVVCVEGSKIHVSTGGAPLLTIPATATSDVVALGTGDGSKCTCTTGHPTSSPKLIVSVTISFDGSGNIFFEDFSLSKHADDDAACPACGSEGCTWFSDSGCAGDFIGSAGSLPSIDFSSTGTWDYYSNYNYGAIRCIADGTLTILPPNPLATDKGVFRLGTLGSPLYSWPVGATVTVNLGGAASYVISYGTNYGGAPGPYRGRLMKDGVQYGVTADTFGDIDTWLDWDGSILRICRWGLNTPAVIGEVDDTIATFTPTITVAGIGTTWVSWNDLSLTKHADDIGGCKECGAPNCTACLPGTFANHAQVTIANITSNSYGCTCTDQTIDLYAAASGCVWTGTKSGPCFSGTWTATATVTAVSGGYKLTVAVTTYYGAAATFEETVLSGSPVDCMTAFDGDVPRVSSSGSGPCVFPAATCSFASP